MLGVQVNVYLKIVNKKVCHCHSLLARQYTPVFERNIQSITKTNSRVYMDTRVLIEILYRLFSAVGNQSQTDPVIVNRLTCLIRCNSLTSMLVSD